MLKATIKTYPFATVEEIARLRLWFVHARGDALHLWSLKIPKPDVLTIKRVYRTVIPITLSNTYLLPELLKMLWTLKLGLDQSCRTLRSLHESHSKYCTVLALGEVDDDDKRPGLQSTIGTRVVKPTRGPGFGCLLPRSFATGDAISL